MPLTEDDQARLPPMVQPEEVSKQQREDDMKAFRRYLVNTGAVKSLTKLYMHVYKNEMRMDNPHCVTEFLASYQEQAQDVAVSVVEENEALRERNLDLLAQVEALSQAVESMAADRAGFSPDQLYADLASPDFWEGAVGEPAPGDAGLSLAQLFRRLCGGSEQVSLLAPAALQGEVGDFPLSRDAFRMWVAHDLSDTERAWCKDILLPRLAEASTEAPFERELLDAVNESGLYPDRSEEVAVAVGFGDMGLQAFIESAAANCVGLAAATAAEDPPMPELGKDC